ncbi:MAG: MFS transporter [Dehalococcoidia bacterium]|nr:MFS transporter [Dehalococcoidia bacterium]
MPPGAFFERHQSLRSLAHRDFRLLLAGATLTGLVMPVQFLTQVFWVQQEYPQRSVLYVGLIAVSRGLAMLIFSLVGGAIADRFERRKVLLGCASAAFLFSTMVSALMLYNPFGQAAMAALLCLTFLAAAAMAIDMPARTAAIPSVVGMADMGNAISLNMVAQQLTIPLSLPLVGALNSVFAPGEVYAGTLLAWAAILPLLAALRFRSIGSANRALSMLGNIREGLSYTRRDAAIFGVIAMVLALQVVGMPGPATLGPLWMTEVLGLSKSQFGMIAMTWGLGAFMASFFFARQHGLARRGATLCMMTYIFAVSAIIFGHSRFVPLTAAVNFILGFAQVGTMVTAATVVQHLVRDEMRGRVMGLFPLAMGLAMLNAGPVSVAGQAVGLEVVVPALAWALLVISALITLGLPALWRAHPQVLERAPAPGAT